MYEAKIIADSVCAGHRLTTMQLTHPRIVHAEFNTHCAFARNASSSRAIPFSKAVQRVIDDPFIPKYWGVNEKGMQASQELTGHAREEAITEWLRARDSAIATATRMSAQLSVHKQIVNRLIEPWSWITVCVTGDASAWSNYFSLRCHPDAQPDIQEQAYMAQYEYFTHAPKELKIGEWHLPYITSEDRERAETFAYAFDTRLIVPDLVKISVGRCARTSYLTQEGKRDFVEDVRLHDRLRYHVPLHASPFEHVCQAIGNDDRCGKYVGWRAYRHMIPREYVEDFSPNHPLLVNKGD
jgi:thymidylate synthase ThyX